MDLNQCHVCRVSSDNLRKQVRMRLVGLIEICVWTRIAWTWRKLSISEFLDFDIRPFRLCSDRFKDDINQVHICLCITNSRQVMATLVYAIETMATKFQFCNQQKYNEILFWKIPNGYIVDYLYLLPLSLQNGLYKTKHTFKLNGLYSCLTEQLRNAVYKFELFV